MSGLSAATNCLCLGVDASEVIWTLLFDDDEFNSDTGDLYDTEITHWMPLPELPTK